MTRHTVHAVSFRYPAAMAYTVTILPAQQTRLNELAALLSECRNAYLRIVEEYSWKAAPGSRASADEADLAASGGRDELIVEAISSYLELAAHHCGGLGGLYTTGEVFASPYQIVRSVVECSARTVWLLGYESSTTTALDRLARAFIDNDLSNEDAQRADKYIYGASSENYQNSKRRFRELRVEIIARFPGDADLANRKLHGQEQGKLTGTVVTFFDTARTHGGVNIDAKVAEGIYIWLSNGTHPTLYPLRRRRRPRMTGDGYVRADLNVEIEDLEWLTRLAVVSLYFALSCAHDYLGQPFDPDGQFAKSVDSVFPGLLREPSSE